MKAVIVEIRGKSVAALCDDGCVIKLKNNNYALGQVVEKSNGKRYRRLTLRVAGLAAAIALTSISAWAYFTPFSYVSLDVNPSLLYLLNRFDRVLSCEAVNDDGKEVVERLQLKNKDIKEAIKITIKEIAAEGYLADKETGGIVIAASSKDQNKSDELARSLDQTAAEAAAEENVEVEIEAESVGNERVREAESLGVTPGKLNLVQKLKESADDTKAEGINTKEWAQKPVKDIMEEIKKNRRDSFSKTHEDRNNSENSEEDNKNSSNDSEKEDRQGKNKNETVNRDGDKDRAWTKGRDDQKTENKNTGFGQYGKETKNAQKDNGGKNQRRATPSRNDRRRNNSTGFRFR